MRFDYEAFFREHAIPYITSGKNVHAGWVGIKCPFCGFEDPSEHMGCNPDSGAFSCWRNSEHKGGGPAKLVQALLGCSWGEAKRITGETGDLAAAPESWEELGRQFEAGDERPAKEERVEYPPGFFPLAKGMPRAFHDYLVRQRGWPVDRLREICGRYCLRGCIRAGEWNRRIILPVHDAGGRLAGWQGRAIGEARLRYRSYPHVIKDYLFNEYLANAGGGTLVVVEGPFGAINLEFFTGPHTHAVATMGVSFTGAQVARLRRLIRRYDRTVLLFDPGAEGQVLRLADTLDAPVILGHLPEGVDGPDEIPPTEVPRFLARLAR